MTDEPESASPQGWRLVLAVALVALGGVTALALGAPPAAAGVASAIATSALAVVALPRPAPATQDREAAPNPEELAVLLDAVVDPLVVLDAGRIVIANGAARALFGDELTDREIGPLLGDPVVADVVRRAQGELVTATLNGLGGALRQWTLRISGLASGRQLIHLVDESAIRAAERMRVDFVANASHELKTPLAAILGFTETLTDDAAGGDAATRARFLAIIAAEATRMQQLVSDLLSLSRIEADRYTPPSDRCDLSHIAADAAGEAGARRNQWVRIDAPGKVEVLGHDGQLGQVVHNLVSNACKYGKPPIEVRLSAADGQAVLTVTDAGEGITPEHLPRLTERFYRVDPGRSRAEGGTGLGLAIVKHIVERHRGTLEIASAAGAGTTVTITLPLAPEAVPAALPAG